MSKTSMVWIVPTVVGMIALSFGSVLSAQDSPPEVIADEVQAQELDATTSEPASEESANDTELVAREPLAEDEQEQSNQESEQDNDQTKAERLTPEQLYAKKQRRLDLDQQFAKLQKTLETADGYSLDLAEDYFGYGLLLRTDGQFDEAAKMFVRALHIQKVNHGIYAAEQRPALRALFDTYYTQGQVEKFEDYLERILWIESKNPQLNDSLSFDMMVKVGNRYIDQFLKRPIAAQVSVQTLLRAKHHLSTALARHRKKPLSNLLMPYGELALISYYESRLIGAVDSTASLDDNRLRKKTNLDGREFALISYLANSYPRGSALLNGYLRKAKAEKDLPHIVKALVSLGDFNQLFGRHPSAYQYYKSAWEKAQLLPPEHEVRLLLSEPVALPSFHYTLERKPVTTDRPSIDIPLLVDLDAAGRVTAIAVANDSELTKRHLSRAKRRAKRTVFRPKIVDGLPQAATALPYDQTVYARKSATS